MHEEYYPGDLEDLTIILKIKAHKMIHDNRRFIKHEDNLRTLKKWFKSQVKEEYKISEIPNIDRSLDNIFDTAMEDERQHRGLYSEKLSSIIADLIKIADDLDGNKMIKEAGAIDSIINFMRG